MSRYDEGGKGDGEVEGEEQVARPSRYRSLRKPPASPSAPSDTKGIASREHGSDQPDGHATASTLSRVMSRYRRRAPTHATSTNLDAGANKTPSVPAIPLIKTVNSSPTAETHAMLAGESPTRHQLQHSNTQQIAGETPIEPTDRVDHAKKSPETSERPNTMEKRDFSWEADRDRLLEEQKRKDLKRLEAELENSARNKAQSPKRRGPVVEKLVLLARGGKSRRNKDEMSPVSPTGFLTRSLTRLSSPESAKSPESIRSPESISSPKSIRSLKGYIEPGGKGIVPQKDAPTSAINAGERNVTVRWQNHAFNLPVTPETTALDIIAQTSRKYGSEMRPEKYLVIERYGVLGLDRRLRHYERIRDVMNSWDRDTQNQLAILLQDPSDNHDDLDASAVADSGGAPSGCQLYMYYSNRPGKWNKGWVTLLESGQILAAKKPNAKLGEKGTTTLCHLSDYDIYTPTESQIKKHIDPPSRLCFAIKSQHKTTVFLNTEKYVQYFSIDDPQDADEFRQKVHGWRNWYLVDRTPEVRKKQTGAHPAKSPPKQSEKVVSANGHRPRVSTDESPYSIGQFEPLLDMRGFDKRLSDFGKDSESNTAAKQKDSQGIFRRFSRKEKSDCKSPRSGKGGDNMEILAGGLLGDGYEIRKQALIDAENNGGRTQPFTDGPSLMNSQRDTGMLQESPEITPSWFPSALEHTAKKRGVSQVTAIQPSPTAAMNVGTKRSPTKQVSQYQYSHAYANPIGSQPISQSYPERRGLPKPLIDLTPKIAEPPQWSQEKKGHGVKPPEGLAHLVDFISVGNGIGGKVSRLPEPPPRTVPRNAMPAPTALARTRSMSSASGRRMQSADDAPPVPLLPAGLDLETGGIGRRLVSDPISADSRRYAGDPVSIDSRLARQGTVKKDAEREREKARLREQRKREYREREAAYNAVPGRTGTLKVV